MQCKVCGRKTEKFGEAVLLGKYKVAYFLCPYCGFLETEQPYWLAESYSSAIADSDTGLVRRNLYFANLTLGLIKSSYPISGNFLDFAGGYGLFVRLMRDQNLSFFRYDKFCPNLFAKEYNVDIEKEPIQKFDLITAFEAAEHFVFPIMEFEKLAKHSDSILISTELMGVQPPEFLKWHYYALNTGQHIAFYTLKTLYYIANKFGYQLFSDGSWTHLFTKGNIDFPRLKRVVVKN